MTSYLNHERHVPDPVQSNNGRRIKHPHWIAMDNFPYPDILCFGDGEGFVGKIRPNKKERKNDRPTKNNKERNISYLERHRLNLDSGWRMFIQGMLHTGIASPTPTKNILNRRENVMTLKILFIKLLLFTCIICGEINSGEPNS